MIHHASEIMILVARFDTEGDGYYSACAMMSWNVLEEEKDKENDEYTQPVLNTSHEPRVVRRMAA